MIHIAKAKKEEGFIRDGLYTARGAFFGRKAAELIPLREVGGSTPCC